MHADSSPKLCECGCGKPAPLSTHNRPDRGQFKGQPVRFINGHNSHRHTDEAKALIAAAGRGRKHTPESLRKQSEIKKGPRNPMWKGGRFVSQGRVWVNVGVDHPMANGSGYAFEHRLVAADVLGRMLSPDEVVHHIDFDPLNNAAENLVVLSPSQHSRLHRLIDQSGMSPDEALRLVMREEVAA